MRFSRNDLFFVFSAPGLRLHFFGGALVELEPVLFWVGAGEEALALGETALCVEDGSADGSGAAGEGFELLAGADPPDGKTPGTTWSEPVFGAPSQSIAGS